jgi:succinate--hydroxymethylglutarate CoA-transferase
MGLMHITGHRDAPPAKVGVAVTDLTTGLYTTTSILAALISRSTTDIGQHLDVALADCQIATLANIASSCLISGKPDSGRWGTAHPSIVPYKGFPTKDGDVMLGGGNDRLFGVLCQRLNKPEWATDAKFKTNADRVQRREELEEMISEITRTKTTKEWLSILEGSGMPYAPINDVKTTLEDEHGTPSNQDSPAAPRGPPPLTYVSCENSLRPRNDYRSQPPLLWSHETRQSTG